MKTVAVTGAKGFIGKHLVEYLKKQQTVQVIYRINRDDIRISMRDNGVWKNWPCPFAFHSDEDILDDTGKSLKRLFFDARLDTLFHCAGNPNTKDQNAFAENITTTNYYLNCCPRGTHIALASSCAVYGTTGLEDADEETPPNPPSMYAASKLCSEIATQTWCKLNGGSCSILRLGAVVGPNMTHGAIPALIKKAQELPDSGGAMQVFGYGKGAVKPYIDIETVCQAFAQLSMQRYNGIVNVASDQSWRIDEIVHSICRLLGKRGYELEFIGDAWPGDSHRVRVKNTKLKYTCNIYPEYSKDIIEQHLQEIIKSV